MIPPHSNPSAGNDIHIPHPTHRLVDEPRPPDTSSVSYPLVSPLFSIPYSELVLQLLAMYLVVGLLTNIPSLRLSISFVFDRQLLVVVRYRYGFYFNSPVVFNACTFDTETLVRISLWASTCPFGSTLSSRSLPLCSVVNTHSRVEGNVNKRASACLKRYSD